MEIELKTGKTSLAAPTIGQPNMILIILDALNWSAWERAAPKNIPALLDSKAVKAHSFACCTLPSLIGYLSNYPPIGVGYGLFDKGIFVEALDLVEGARHSPTRAWMPLYYKEKGYHTSIYSGNAVLAEADQYMGIRKHFDVWAVQRFLNDKVLDATPDVIKRFEYLCMHEGQEQPLFSVLWLFDTHFPFSDGEKVLNPPFRSGMKTMNACVKALEYTDEIVVPALIRALKSTGRSSVVIVTSDHGENHGGEGAGHNPYTCKLRMTDELFSIPYIEGIVKP